MRKSVLITLAVLYGLAMFYGISHAQDYSKVEIRVSGNDGTTTKMDSGLNTSFFTADVRQTQEITCAASAFTAFTVPSGYVKGIMIDPGSSRGLQLKGVTGDVGISLDTTCPVLIPFSRDNITIGIRNNVASAQDVTVFWF